MEIEIRSEEKSHISSVKKILDDNLYLLTDHSVTNIDLSTVEQDTKESFDFVYNSNVNLHIAVRIRKNKYLSWCDLTIRSQSRYGGKTEIDKIIEGKGNIYFYAWKDKTNSTIEEWVIIDVNKIREYIIDNEAMLRANERLNKYDGTALIGIALKEVGCICYYGDTIKTKL